ncbi:hypothetical protein [Hyphomicrobium sp.]|uniref:hypothetical protein n=1 Tax=Hyphomicrobium sp. TaxID=82 RepID=UPI000FC3B217|nr:hypothetical protein [Hyphomicrobium sp.]RUO99222.1 MAG: hypothetical protein EKK30_08290 [Hyphomicrobium sp.]
MRQLRRNIVVRDFLLALYVLSAATFGFAHKPITIASSVDLSAYALPDGSLPFICGGKNGPAGKHVCALCDACLISAAPGLLSDHEPPSELPGKILAEARPDDYRAHVGSDRPLSFRSRAPPQLET